MFGLGSALLLPPYKQEEQRVDQSFKKRGPMKLFNPFTIPKKDNCDLCRIKTNKRKATENPFLEKIQIPLQGQV